MSKISKKRKATYYVGIGIIIIGFALFISVFFSMAKFVSDPTDLMYGPSVFNPPSFSNGLVGFILIIAGAVVMSAGARGAAGSGLVLDRQGQGGSQTVQ